MIEISEAEFLRGTKAAISLARRMTTYGLLLAMAVATKYAHAQMSWQEEVRLHDGSKIVAERSQSYGGRHEIGQTPPIREQEIAFTVPGSGERIVWKSEYGEDIGRSNFILLALHILGTTPYIVATPNLCLSYNKWGRPNPPYVIFKYEDKEWRRISQQELPAEFKSINLVVSTKAEEKTISAQSVVVSEQVKTLNSTARQPEYRSIVRGPLKGLERDCGEMIYDGSGGWIGIGWFREQPSREACMKFCERKKMGEQHCPCETLFGEK